MDLKLVKPFIFTIVLRIIKNVIAELRSSHKGTSKLFYGLVLHFSIVMSIQ